MKYRDLLRILEHDGWQNVRTKGSHRIYRHPVKEGIVVVAGSTGREIPPGTYRQILKQAGLKEQP